jgi:hypothetical protein
MRVAEESLKHRATPQITRPCSNKTICPEILPRGVKGSAFSSGSNIGRARQLWESRPAIPRPRSIGRHDLSPRDKPPSPRVSQATSRSLLLRQLEAPRSQTAIGVTTSGDLANLTRRAHSAAWHWQASPKKGLPSQLASIIDPRLSTRAPTRRIELPSSPAVRPSARCTPLNLPSARARRVARFPNGPSFHSLRLCALPHLLRRSDCKYRDSFVPGEIRSDRHIPTAPFSPGKLAHA